MAIWYWYGLMAGAVLLWPASLAAGMMLFPQNALASFGLFFLILALHAAELPFAYPVGRDRGIRPATTLVKILIFGFTWWVPLKKGIIRQ